MREKRRRQRAGRHRGAKLVAREAGQAYGEGLESLPWDWFATLTLRERATEQYLLKCHQDWTVRIQDPNGPAIRQALAIELQLNGTPHGHALLHGVPPAMSRATAARIWKEISG